MSSSLKFGIISGFHRQKPLIYKTTAYLLLLFSLSFPGLSWLLDICVLQLSRFCTQWLSGIEYFQSFLGAKTLYILRSSRFTWPAKGKVSKCSKFSGTYFFADVAITLEVEAQETQERTSTLQCT